MEAGADEVNMQVRFLPPALNTGAYMSTTEVIATVATLIVVCCIGFNTYYIGRE